MRSDRVDVAILGGGCAGLSLAVRLAERGLAGRRVVVLEAREAYARDRTWCGWSVRPHRFESCVTHRWGRWAVRNEGREVVHRSDSVAYEHIPADAFYAEARSVIAAHPDVELHLGTPALDVRETSAGVRIETARGRFHADLVVDTRPAGAGAGPRKAPRSRGLVQHFGGWHLRTQEPVFDPGTVTLMDFDVPQDDGLHFTYVLPFAPDEALVESTFIGNTPFRDGAARDPYGRWIRRYLRRRYGTSAREVVWRERGAIPMQAFAHEPDGRGANGRIVRAGTVGGAVKPSSGYGFLSIQRQASELTRRILSGLPPEQPRPRSRLDEGLDAIFLRFLTHRPERAPRMFERLFDQVAPEPLARFLMEEGTLADRARVIGAMPTLPFLREALVGAAG